MEAPKHPGSRSLISAAFFFLFILGLAPSLRSDESVEAELESLETKVANFSPIPLPAGTSVTTLTKEQSLTIEKLRGTVLDDAPPSLGGPVPVYAANMTDSFAPGEAPYVARDIEPFRFRHFHCEFNYGGWHNFGMMDYASTHGFDILYPYVRTVEQSDHLPEGIQWLSWGNFINWHTWFGEHDLPAGRYDLLVDLDLVKIHLDEKRFEREVRSSSISKRGDALMIDLEHPVLSPEQLRQQPWYPAKASETDRNAFEKRYYDGYARTYTSAVLAARKSGWKNISIYGWQPFGRTWGGLEKSEIDPGTDHAWNAFGRQIYESVDLIHNSVYCFYWSPQNVAYTLAGIDANLALINSMPEKKPLRPYFWTLLHGGGGGWRWWRWWRGQPLTNEDKRAMIAMVFFTGIDGFDTWNWSGTGNHHRPELSSSSVQKDFFASGKDVMLKDEFECVAEDGTTTEIFHRYDVLHLLEPTPGSKQVRFQKIRNGVPNYGVQEDQPVFSLPIEDLNLHLRAKSEPVAAMIEGMALVKPLEYTLRHGEVKIDVPARRQFNETLPIVRRVKYGDIHVLITYDPKAVSGGEERTIELENFDGCEGRSLHLPADAETRIFVLRES